MAEMKDEFGRKIRYLRVSVTDRCNLNCIYCKPELNHPELPPSEILSFEESPPALDKAMWKTIEEDRAELAGDFCRACGYCLPCPAEIPIPMAARMHLLLRRAPWRNFVTSEWREKMSRIENCTDCGQCKERCPYGLDTPRLLRKAYDYYQSFCESHPPAER